MFDPFITLKNEYLIGYIFSNGTVCVSFLSGIHSKRTSFNKDTLGPNFESGTRQLPLLPILLPADVFLGYRDINK